MKYSNKKYYQTLFLLLSLLIFNCSFLIATVRYVSHTGSSIPPYTTWENAADSIQKCINICVFGDTIYVANGVYEEQVVMIPGLSLIGSGADSCIVDSRSLISAWDDKTIEITDSCLLRGFKIIVSNSLEYGMGIAGPATPNTLVTQNKITNSRWGIFLEFYSSINDATVYKNIVEEVVYGIWLFNSNSSVRENIIITTLEAQTIPEGIYTGGFSYSYTPTIDSNYIETFGYGIYKFNGSRPTIRNNILKMDGGEGIVIQQSDTAKVFNNLILNVGAGIESNSFTNLFIFNNYIVGKPSGLFGIKVGPNSVVKNNVVTNSNVGIGKYGSQNPTIQYNNLWNNILNYDGIVPDSTSLSVDPMIVNEDTTQGELDFHLQKYSPLIDAGDPNILDKDGTRSDIGLYGGPYGESYVYQDLAPKPPKNLTAVVDSSIITLSWNRNTEADFNHYNLYRDTTSNFQIDSTKLVASLTDTFYLHLIPPGVERLYFKLTGVDNQGNESNPSEEVEVILVSVKNEWNSADNYILYQNYPNPFNPTTKIGYKLKERGYVKLYVYDIKGELVEILVNQTQEAGYYEVEFNGEGKTELIKVKNPFVSGVYLCQIIVQSEKGIPVFSDMIKMVLLK
jgi:parallel beta-helix repeat protein